MKWLNRVGVLCMAALACAVFGASPAFGASSTSGKDIIRIVSPYPTTTLDPNHSIASGNLEKFWELYATLIRYDTDGKLVPGLAKSWTFSDDGKQLTLKLRAAKFSDGSPMTAEDVVFTLRRVMNSKTTAYPAPVAAIASVDAKGDHTVVITLKHPYAPILANLTIYNTGIVSKKAVQGHEDAFASHPVTSGPYRVKEWKPNNRLILEANPYYWRKGYPKNDGAEFIFVGDPNTRIAMLRSGKVDAVRGVPWSRMDKLGQRDNIRVPQNPSTQIYEVLLNHAKGPFSDMRVRRAAAFALNREAIVKAVTFDHAKVANTTLNNTLKFYDADFSYLSYDPAKAKKLLKEADAVGTNVVILTASPEKKLATLIQAEWNAVGFKARVELVDNGTWWQRLVGGDYDAAPNWYLNETSDPDLAVRWALCGKCGNRSYYTNYDDKKIDELTEQAARAQDPATRKKLYHKIQAITTRNIAQIPLYYPVFNNAYSTRVEGLYMTSHVHWTLAQARVVQPQ